MSPADHGRGSQTRTAGCRPDLRRLEWSHQIAPSASPPNLLSKLDLKSDLAGSPFLGTPVGLEQALKMLDEEIPLMSVGTFQGMY